MRMRDVSRRCRESLAACRRQRAPGSRPDICSTIETEARGRAVGGSGGLQTERWHGGRGVWPPERPDTAGSGQLCLVSARPINVVMPSIHI